MRSVPRFPHSRPLLLLWKPSQYSDVHLTKPSSRSSLLRSLPALWAFSSLAPATCCSLAFVHSRLLSQRPTLFFDLSRALFDFSLLRPISVVTAYTEHTTESFNASHILRFVLSSLNLQRTSSPLSQLQHDSLFTKYSLCISFAFARTRTHSLYRIFSFSPFCLLFSLSFSLQSVARNIDLYRCLSNACTSPVVVCPVTSVFCPAVVAAALLHFACCTYAHAQPTHIHSACAHPDATKECHWIAPFQVRFTFVGSCLMAKRAKDLDCEAARNGTRDLQKCQRWGRAIVLTNLA